MYKFVIQRDGAWDSWHSVAEFQANTDEFFDLEWLDTQSWFWKGEAKKKTPADILREDPEASFIWQQEQEYYSEGEMLCKTTIDWYEDGVHRMKVEENG